MVEDQTKTRKPTVKQVDEKLKYPEIVHVITDYMVEGTDFANWDNICEKKFIFSYGIGEATVETKDRKMVIPCVLYTPKTTLNILSIDQLEDQGYVVKYGHNKCSITYMFDDNSGDTRTKESQNHEEITNKDEEDHVHKETESMVAKHNKYLEAYFDSIDPKEECSLIKGLEELKWDKNEVHDYLDEDYISMNGTLYAIKVNSFPRFIFFLNLIKKDSIVYKNWEVLRKRFLDMIKWFYLVFLNQDMLEPLPPVIGDVEIDLLGLYKMINSMGGYLSVTLENKWKEVAVIHGLTEAHEDELKSCYKRTIEMVKCYYDTTMKPWFREEPVKTKMVEDGRDYAKKENPRGCDGLEVGIRNTCQGNKTRFGVNLEDNKTMTIINEADQEDSASTSRSNDFIVIT
ncbi:ARID DNA-binding domain-containing protein [Tanacetum coccineum]|uniref:ARID DNA-binding domain-containing protein n=1 Tax=Tanacetum coccineum TaxID=301880 RepID=A0ABQ5GQF2_9ASTR